MVSFQISTSYCCNTILYADNHVCFVLRAGGALIGQGINNFMTDWDKISATVSYACTYVHVNWK